MISSTISRALVLGDQPRASAQALGGGLAIAGVAVFLRFVAPALLLGPELTFLAAIIGFLLAAAVGRHDGGILIGILVAVLPVFAFDAASTALREPATLGVAIRAARGAAWYSLGVAVLVAGPFGYALGGVSRSDNESICSSPRFGTHCRVDRSHSGPLFIWCVLAVGIVVVWTVFPVSSTPSPVAAAPIPVAAGLGVATLLGYRARGALAAVIAGSIGGSVGMRLFTQEFVTLAVGTGVRSPLLFVGRVMVAGFIAGLPFGVVGYLIGRQLNH